ncbi:hypothetical protein [Peribacillus asahii]|uniref:hypothetical protein n=1 Tax=Peribacillus asahii TaxID=228899 RepID=UPI00381F6CA9
MHKKSVISIISIILAPLSLLNLGLIIPWNPLIDIHTYLGNIPLLAAFVGTKLGIPAIIRKEPKRFRLIGLILNGVPLALYIIIMIMMFLSFVVGI